LRHWYRVEVVGALRRLALPLVIIAAIAVLGFWSSYRWATVTVPRLLSSASEQQLSEIVREARDSAGLVGLDSGLSAIDILANNVRATSLVFLGGLMTFSVLGIGAYLLNIGLIGGVLGIFGTIGYAPGKLLVAGLLPHGIFEMPALMLVSASILRFGALLVTPQTGKSMGQILLELLADSAKVLLGVVFPLLIVAAVVEAHVTPAILGAALP
jgi:stage II sporulation protein M